MLTDIGRFIDVSDKLRSLDEERLGNRCAERHIEREKQTETRGWGERYTWRAAVSLMS